VDRSPAHCMVALVAALIVAVLAVPPLAWSEPESGENPQAQYAEPDACGLCHRDVADEAAGRLHGAILERRAAEAKGQNCQTCHGPSQAHVENPIEVKTAWTPELLKRNTSAKMCLNCHSNQIPAITWRKGDHHSGGVQCWDCHSADRPAKAHSEFIARPNSSVCLECHREVEGLFRLNSHHPVILGTEQERVTCADCHDVHGRRSQRDWAQKCRSCHLEQRGPHRFEHGAISGRLMGSCLECHSPHGSPNANLLRFNSRGLCLQCHGDKVTHFPGPACWSCHEAIHGSNSHPQFLTP